MKKLNEFLESSPHWVLFIFCWFLCTVVVAFTFYGMNAILPSEDPNYVNAFTPFACLKIGAGLGILFGLLMVLMIQTNGKSSIFWELARQLEAEIEETETKEQILSLYENKFNELRKRSLGGPHSTEIVRLDTIMQTRIKFLK
jgi:hypothetical protein